VSDKKDRFSGIYYPESNEKAFLLILLFIHRQQFPFSDGKKINLRHSQYSPKITL